MSKKTETVVMKVQGVHWASSKAVVESLLSRQAGILNVDANPVAQSATVTFDPELTSIADLTKWVRDCGYHRAGRFLPDHICDPMEESGTSVPKSHDMASMDHAKHTEPAGMNSLEVMGHGGGHGGMSMDSLGEFHLVYEMTLSR